MCVFLLRGVSFYGIGFYGISIFFTYNAFNTTQSNFRRFQFQINRIIVLRLYVWVDLRNMKYIIYIIPPQSNLTPIYDSYLWQTNYDKNL